MTKLKESDDLRVVYESSDAYSKGWYYKFSSQESRCGPYETRVKAIKAAYRFENPEKDTSMDDKDRALIALGFICLGVWITQGFGYACIVIGTFFLGRLLWQHINQIKDVK